MPLIPSCTERGYIRRRRICYDIPIPVNKGERNGTEEGGVLYSCTEFIIIVREWGIRAVHNIPYNGPTIQKETTVAVSHVKSPLNAGGGLDIVTSLEGGVLEAKCRTAEVPYFKYSLRQRELSDEHVIRILWPQNPRREGMN